MTPDKIAEVAKRIRERIFERAGEEGRCIHASSMEQEIVDELTTALVEDATAVAYREWIPLYAAVGFNFSDITPDTRITMTSMDPPVWDIFK